MLVKIFVEGEADRKFLSDYVFSVYGNRLPNDVIIVTKGWTAIKSSDNSISNAMLRNSDNGGINLLIFDADNDYKNRLKEIESWRLESKVAFDVFLWPNNLENGDLETVLEHCINPNNVAIFECWASYERCLQSRIIEGRAKSLTTPARKTKIYAYLEALLGESKSEKKKIKEAERDYTNIDFWDLKSEYLKPLKQFLDSYFKK